MTDGIGPMSAMPTFLAKLGVKVRSAGLSQELHFTHPRLPGFRCTRLCCASSRPWLIFKNMMQFLQTYWLREKAGSMAYYDKETYATADAVRIGRVHTFMPG